MKYTRSQICEALSYWQKQLLNESNVPVISSIQEFLDVCKKQGVKVEKKKVIKQPKTVDARIAKEKEEVFSRESKRIKGKGEKADAGDLIIDDVKKDEKKAGMKPYHFAYVVKKEKIPQFYEVKSNGDSITGDNTQWKKHGGIKLDYYLTPIDVDVKVRWQDEPLHATKGYSLVINVDKNGEPDPTDISPVAPEIFKDPLFWKPVDSVNESMHSLRHITEAISYWNKQLKRINESQKRIDEGKIADFFGKLFKTQAWKKQQEEIKKAKEDAEWEDIKKEHPFALAAELIKKAEPHLYKTAFGNVEWDDTYARGGGKGDILIVKNEALGDYKDNLEIKSLDDPNHKVIANSLKKAGIDINNCGFVHYNDDPCAIVIFPKRDCTYRHFNTIEKTKSFD